MDDARKMLYFNVANGVTLERAAEAIGMDVAVAHETFRAVGLALAAKQMRETMPYVPCQTEGAARQNRKQLVPLLETLDLDEKLEYRRVVAAPITRDQ